MGGHFLKAITAVFLTFQMDYFHHFGFCISLKDIFCENVPHLVVLSIPPSHCHGTSPLLSLVITFINTSANCSAIVSNLSKDESILSHLPKLTFPIVWWSTQLFYMAPASSFPGHRVFHILKLRGPLASDVRYLASTSLYFYRNFSKSSIFILCLINSKKFKYDKCHIAYILLV